MTQPVQEPTTQRSISQGQWGERQLFRRPAPVGDSGLSVWGYIAWTDGADVPNDTFWQPDDDAMDWTEAYTSPDADAIGAISPNLTTGVVLCDNNVDGINFLWRLHALAQWADTPPAAGTWLGLRISPIAAGLPLANPTTEGWAPADMVLNEGAGPAVSHTTVASPTANTVTFQVSAYQNSGGNLFLSALVLWIVRDENFDTTNGTFYP